MTSIRMHSRHLPLALATLAGLSAAGAGVGAEVGAIIAKGGSIELGSTDVQSLVATLPEESRQSVHTNLPALEQLVRAEIVQRAVLSDARGKNFDHDPNTAQQLERIRSEALTRLWLASKAVVPADYPSDADVKAAYEALRGALPVEYHLAQIFISAPNGQDPAKMATALHKAVDVGGRLNTGDFAQLAKEQSEHADSAAKGGDLGFLPADRMMPEILKAVRSLSPGQIAGPVKTAEGLHFIKLVETRPVTLPPLADIRQRLVADLRVRRGQQLEQAYINELRTKLSISINEIELAKLQAGLK
jgi:parvulin-like peptidyl-prolyl isomerase